jgi:xanthine dehydrogenase accessory factor
LLDQRGIAAGDEAEGIAFAKNSCPSQGTMDIFVEPVLPRPEIVVCGSSPVAVAIADLGRKLGFLVTACAPAEDQATFADVERRIEGYALPVGHDGKRFIVVSTQSRGDEAALQAALSVEADYVAFVGSRKKADALKRQLAERGIDRQRIDTLKAPAGLDIGAITPEEIALSILSEIVALHRKGQRAGDA